MAETIPNEMRALVLPAPGKLEIQNGTSAPAPITEVLCKVRGVAICGSDPEILRGDLAGTWPPEYPFIPGHEWSGQVVAVGRGVVDLQRWGSRGGSSAQGVRRLQQLHGRSLHDLRKLWASRDLVNGTTDSSRKGRTRNTSRFR